jgi:hypothetical protein
MDVTTLVFIGTGTAVMSLLYFGAKDLFASFEDKEVAPHH